MTRGPAPKANRIRRTLWARFTRDPILLVTQLLYTHRPPLALSQRHGNAPIRLVCIADTHNETPSLPRGDIVIHAGDLSLTGTFAELQDQLHWLNALPHSHVLVIAGHHDLLLDQTYYMRAPNTRFAGPHNSAARGNRLDWGRVVYLCNSSTTLCVRGREVSVYGSPYTPKYGNWAFEYARERDVWRGSVPRGTDVLVTHGPAKGRLDDEGKGCGFLGREVWRSRPRVHVCGHIHVGRGREGMDWGCLDWVNDAIMLGGKRKGVEVVLLMVMLVCWLGKWVVFVLCLGRKGRAKCVSVNAAVVTPDGLKEGSETITVEL